MIMDLLFIKSIDYELCYCRELRTS